MSTLCKLCKYPRLSGVSRRDDLELHLSVLADNLVGPGKFYELERHFWIEVWRAVPPEVVEDGEFEMRGYGPVRAFTIADAPRTALFNLVLGAGRPGAVEDGHLEAALEWTESLGLDCRIPVRLEPGEGEVAEALLGGRGYRAASTQVLFVRNAAPPGFPGPEGIEVVELSEESEGLSDILATGYNMEWTGHGVFLCLPAHSGWRAHIAIDTETEYWIGAATMLLHHEVAQLGFASTYKSDRGRGAQAALLRRQIAEAIAAGSEWIFAISEEPLDYPRESSSAARCLLRAGFRPRAVRTVWRPPGHLLADEEDENELDDGWGEGGDDFDEDHDFRLHG
jgi:hypothetical protein